MVTENRKIGIQKTQWNASLAMRSLLILLKISFREYIASMVRNINNLHIAIAS